MIGFSLKDFRAEAIGVALNNATVVDTAAVAGVAGFRSVGVSGNGCGGGETRACWYGWIIRRMLSLRPVRRTGLIGLSSGGRKFTK